MSQVMFQRLLRAGAVLLDSCLILLAFFLAGVLRSRLGFLDDAAGLDRILTQARPLGVALWVVVIAVFGGYSTREYGSGTEAYRRVFNASVAVVTLLATALFLTRTSMSRAYFILLFLIGIPLVLLGRFLGRRVLQWLYRSGYGTKRVMIVGDAHQVDELTGLLRGSRWLGLDPVGAVGPPHSSTGLDGLPRLDPETGLLPLARALQVDLILFTAGAVPSSTDFRRYVWQFEGQHTQLAVVPSLVDVAADRIRTRPVAGMPIVYVEDPRSNGALSRGKRVFDLVLATLILVLVSPWFLLTALAVRLTDYGPVFFRQERIGQDGKPFTMLKFRSMVVDAEQRLKALQGGHDTNTVMFKLEKDPRVTRVGGFIRRFSIDELPQLVNVLRGDMSLIGPRPPLPREVALYTDDEWRRMRVRPGLTGLWQVSGRSDLSWEETIRLDLYYIDNWSALQDLSILVRTVRAVLSPRGAY